MVFASLALLWVLVPLFILWTAAFVALHLWDRRRRVRVTAALRYSTLQTLQRLRPANTLRLRQGVQAMRILTMALLVMGLLRPQTGRRETKVWSQGVDIMLAIDTSRSMEALDMDPDKPIAQRRTRLKVVREVVEKFVQRREADQIGMVVFGAEAFTQCPLTLDHGIVATFLEQVQSGMAGDQTAIGSGLAAAVNRLRKSKAKSKVVILLTDGSNNATLTPRKAAEVASKFNIKVYTIGAGGRGQAPFLVDTLFGKQVQYADVDIDERTLRDIANVTHGAYFRAEDGRALEAIYSQIDQLEKSEIQMQSYMEYNERFAWFVIPALVLLLLEIVLLGTRLRKIP